MFWSLPSQILLSLLRGCSRALGLGAGHFQRYPEEPEPPRGMFCYQTMHRDILCLSQEDTKLPALNQQRHWLTSFVLLPWDPLPSDGTGRGLIKETVNFCLCCIWQVSVLPKSPSRCLVLVSSILQSSSPLDNDPSFSRDPWPALKKSLKPKDDSGIKTSFRMFPFWVPAWEYGPGESTAGRAPEGLDRQSSKTDPIPLLNKHTGTALIQESLTVTKSKK